MQKKMCAVRVRNGLPIDAVARVLVRISPAQLAAPDARLM